MVTTASLIRILTGREWLPIGVTSDVTYVGKVRLLSDVEISCLCRTTGWVDATAIEWNRYRTSTISDMLPGLFNLLYLSPCLPYLPGGVFFTVVVIEGNQSCRE